MSRRIAGTAICVTLALLCFPALAVASFAPPSGRGHTVSVSPPSGDFSTTFRFTGRRWQPRKGGTVAYFTSESASQPFKTFRFKPNRRGRFVFTFLQPVVIDSGATQGLCFRQRDTRFGRTFTTCAAFYVEPPTAWIVPSAGSPGDRFLLFARGFPPGRTLNGTILRPDATNQPFTLTARTRGALVGLGSWGHVYVPRGGAARTFSSPASDPPGTYVLTLVEPVSGARAETAVTLTP